MNAEKYFFYRFSAMPRVVSDSISGGFFVATDADPNKHFEGIALDLGRLGYEREYADVNIHCRNQILFKVMLNMTS